MTNYRGNGGTELKWWELAFPLAPLFTCKISFFLNINLINSLITYPELKEGD